MKLTLQNQQKAEKLQAKIGNGQKRIRRIAPLFTLVWSEEVRALSDLTTKQVRELRAKAMWRIELAEAALSDDPAVVKLGGQAHAGDAVWSKFPVGGHWFCLEFRPAIIREYVVTLASPPSPDDPLPSSGDDASIGVERAEALSAEPGNQGEGSSSALRLKLDAALRRAITVWRKIELTLRDVKLSARDIKLRSTLLRALVLARKVYRNLSYRLPEMRVTLSQISRRLASTLATCRISFTRLHGLPAAHSGAEARLEPRCVGQNSGIGILLYSWILDEQSPIDWSADLFGVVPIDWAANLFGALPEKERVFT